MEQLLVLLYAFLFVLSVPPPFVAASPGEVTAGQKSDHGSLEYETIYSLNSAELDRLLSGVSHRFPDYDSRLQAIADLYVGAQYDNDPLTDETNNWLPFERTNCTMFVLYVTAFVNSASHQEALIHMRNLHYRNALVGFKNRYHFTADRITDRENKYFTEITRRCVNTPNDVNSVTVNLNRKNDGSSFFGGRLGNWSRKVTVSYIPKEGFHSGLLRNLPKAVGIAFVKKSNWEKGVIVGHEGFLINGNLYHSSPTEGVTVVPDYLLREFPRSQWEGIIFFSINSVPLPKSR